jgi:hypothetical protein
VTSKSKLRKAYQMIADWHHLQLSERPGMRHEATLEFSGELWLAEVASRRVGGGNIVECCLSASPDYAVDVATKRWLAEITRRGV